MTNGPLLIIAARGQIIAFRRDNGTLVWRFEYKTTFMGMDAGYDGGVELAIHGTRVYAAIRDQIICLDYMTGAVAGDIRLPTPSLRPTFLIEGDHLYLTASDRVMCFDLAGKFIWQTPHGLTITTGAAMGVPGNVRQGDEKG